MIIDGVKVEVEGVVGVMVGCVLGLGIGVLALVLEEYF